MFFSEQKMEFHFKVEAHQCTVYKKKYFIHYTDEYFWPPGLKASVKWISPD